MITSENLNVIATYQARVSYYGSDTESNTQKAEAVIAECLTFNSKEEYLAWVKDWKIRYAQLTKDSRSAKLSRKGTKHTGDLQTAVNTVWHLRRHANVLLFLRHGGKKLSWKMKQARLQNT